MLRFGVIQTANNARNMKNLTVTIKGLSPLLMHRFPMEPIAGLDKKPAIEQAEVCLYVDPKTGRPYIPGENIHRALISAAAYSKGKGRASLQKQVSAALFVDTMVCLVEGSPWVVDSRPVVVPATKGRIVRHRPRFDEWETTFDVSYDDVLLSAVQVREIIDNCGARTGLLDFRPEKKGPFGRFMVTSWEEHK